jgi:FkbM family methyltransferase
MSYIWGYEWAYPYIDKSTISSIFEIGSRDCLDANHLSNYFNCIVTSFECNPDCILECLKNKHKDNVILETSAVSDKDGIVEFHPFIRDKYDNIGASSLFEIDFVTNRSVHDRDYGKKDIQSKIQVESIRLDTYLKDKKCPDLICMDVQEAELLVLKGLGDKIKDVKYIITEASLLPTYSGGCTFFEIDEYLKKNGFEFVRTNEGTSFPVKTNIFSYLDVLYKKKQPVFDIVIPVGPSDSHMIKHHIQSIQKNVLGYRNIYIVTPVKDIDIEGAIVIEDYFSIDEIAKYHGYHERNGWYLQQLLKLYAWKYIPDLLDTYLVIDSDTFFVKPTVFLENEHCLYAYGTEYHIPYFDHMKRLHPSFERTIPCSGICHHMMFQTKYVKELLKRVEEFHGNGLEFWQLFLTQVDQKEMPYSGASEYELYFHYMFRTHPEHVKIRYLHWVNSPSHVDPAYDFISWHWYSRDANYKTLLTFLNGCEASK